MESSKEQSSNSSYLSKIASQCQGVARNLSYNDGVSGDAKHMLIEASHALDSQSTKVHKKKDGLLIINARGKSRFMTIKERIAYFMLDGKTEIRA